MLSVIGRTGTVYRLATENGTIPYMETRFSADKQHAHVLVDRVPADQMTAAVRFLEFLLLDPADRALATAPVEDEEIGEEEEQAVARSKEWFQHNEGIPFGQVATDLGFTMEQIRSHRSDEEHDPAA
jgi:hypothetical protein